jgi:broad specificity phosphatase PhoE
MYTLVLIRHGECVSNQRKTIVKNDDEDLLTLKGCTQAKLTGKALKPFLEKRSLKLYSSTLVRAKLSAEIIKTEVDYLMKVEHDERLIEKTLEESYEEVFRRFNDFVGNVISKENEPDLCLIVTHGNLIQSVIGNTLGLTDCSQIEVTNCGVSVLRNRKLLACNMILHLAEVL